MPVACINIIIPSYFISELMSSIGERDGSSETVSHPFFIFISVLESCMIAYTEGQNKSSSNGTRRFIDIFVLNYTKFMDEINRS